MGTVGLTITARVASHTIGHNSYQLIIPTNRQVMMQYYYESISPILTHPDDPATTVPRTAIPKLRNSTKVAL